MNSCEEKCIEIVSFPVPPKLGKGESEPRVRGLFKIIALSIITFQLHTSETSSAIPQPKVQHELTDAELKQFGYNCNKLPYALWVNALDFLLGTEHEILFFIEQQVISDLRQNNKVKIGRYGQLIACYKNHLYAWCLYGMHIAPQKSWYAQSIPKGWSLDHFENGSIVLINNKHDSIQVLDDMSFKQQAHYALPKHSLFWVANKGRTLVHCAHPLLTKSPILNMHVVTQHDGEKDAKIQQSSHMIRMPHGGVMPPIALDESGKLLAAHATERDELYMIDLQATHKSSAPSPRKIVLSERAINPQGDYAGWILRNPATQEYEHFVVALRRTAFTHSTAAVVKIAVNTLRPKSAPAQPLYFFQRAHDLKKVEQLGDINFVSSAKHAPHVVSLSMTTTNDTESYALDYWDSESGKKIRSLQRTSDDGGTPVYDTGTSDKVVLCNTTECYVDTHHASDLRLLSQEDNRGQHSGVRISPSGDWVLHYNHMQASEKHPHVLTFPKIWYLAGERMKKLTIEDSKIDRRKWMMRLYALEQACRLNLEELRPPQAMQDALGMKFAPPHKYDKGSTSKKKDSCIIS